MSIFSRRSNAEIVEIQLSHDKLLDMIPRLANIIKKEGLLYVSHSPPNSSDSNASLARQLINQRLITPDRLAQMIAKRTGYRHINSLKMLQLDADVFDRVPMGIFRWFDAFPVSLGDGWVHVVLLDPTDQLALQQLRFFTACQVKPMVASLDLIDLLFAKFQPNVKLPFLDSSQGRMVAPTVIRTEGKGSQVSRLQSRTIVPHKQQPEPPKVPVTSLSPSPPPSPQIDETFLSTFQSTDLQQNIEPSPLDFSSLQEVDDDIESSTSQKVPRSDSSFDMHRDPDSIVIPSQQLKSDDPSDFSDVNLFETRVEEDPLPSYEAVEQPAEMTSDTELGLSLVEIVTEEVTVLSSSSKAEIQLEDSLKASFDDSLVEATNHTSMAVDLPEPLTGLHPGVGHLNQLLVKVSLQSNPQKLFEVISDACVKIGIHSGVLFNLQLMESGSSHYWTLDSTSQRVTQNEMPEPIEDLGIKTIMEMLHSGNEEEWVSLKVKLGYRWQVFADAWVNSALPPTHMYSTPTKTGQKLVAMMRFSGLAYHKTLMMTSIQVLKAAAKRL